jgi:hypothetical protein
MEEERMHTRILHIALALATGLATVSAAEGAEVAQAHHAGSCGQYMYWHDGKCVDARNRPPDGWSDSMTKKPAW